MPRMASRPLARGEHDHHAVQRLHVVELFILRLPHDLQVAGDARGLRRPRLARRAALVRLDLNACEARGLQQRGERGGRVQVALVLAVGRCPPLACAAPSGSRRWGWRLQTLDHMQHFKARQESVSIYTMQPGPR
jgi:hypothetical protein